MTSLRAVYMGDIPFLTAPAANSAKNAMFSRNWNKCVTICPAVYLEVEGYRPVPTLTFCTCVLVLLQEICTVSWLNAIKEITIHQNIPVVITLYSLCTQLPRGRQSIKILIMIKLQFTANSKPYIGIVCLHITILKNNL